MRDSLRRVNVRFDGKQARTEREARPPDPQGLWRACALNAHRNSAHDLLISAQLIEAAWRFAIFGLRKFEFRECNCIRVFPS